MTDTSHNPCGKIDLTAFFHKQLSQWPLARDNYKALEESLRTTVDVEGQPIVVQHNAARIRSSAAKTDRESIAKRPCFLCRANRPPQQIALDWGNYEILVNPYPIFAPHFTIAEKSHTPQALAGRLADMLRLAEAMEGMTVFYNGPTTGASAPDHMHFQAVPSHLLPMWHSLDHNGKWNLAPVWTATDADPSHLARRADGMLWALCQGSELPANLYARCLPDGTFQLVLLPRKAHRPHNYGSEPGRTLISLASAEMAGVMVAPRREDYDYCLDPTNVRSLFSDCALGHEVTEPSERTLDVGIVNAHELEVELHGTFVSPSLDKEFTDTLMLLRSEGPDTIDCSGHSLRQLTLIPQHDNCRFTLRNVTIGIGFHWQQHEDQSFHGTLLVNPTPTGLQAVNRVGMETYLRSVVSSEMNANAPEEFLKAHAVISRSWVLAQVIPPSHLRDHKMKDTESELVKWYDRDSHTGFDICADDHCQRYQGCTKASTPQVEAALKATCGEVLAFDNDLCDARFSKCCGGITERFDTCWQPTHLPYLEAIDDPFCGRATSALLKRVLNNYDRPTSDYYRWTVTYTAQELAAIIRTRSGIDYGRIISLTPLHRGPSGRIDRLEIKGTERTRIIGKELEIRRTLSPSHLYSSSFQATGLEPNSEGIPAKWTLSGLGWGHGVGLCQIGAAQMAAEGYDYSSILSFYFPGSRLIKLYDNE